MLLFHIITFLLLLKYFNNRAKKILDTNDLKVNLISYEVDVCADPNKAVVFLLDNNKIRGTNMYSVDLTRKTCTCLHYQQSGVPCYHAIALIRFQELTMTSSFFHDFCFDTILKEMFKDLSIYSPSWPSENNVQMLIDEQFGSELIPLLAE